MENLEKAIAELRISNTPRLPIVVFANWAYREVLQNWLAAMRRLQLEQELIIALDEQTHQFLVAGGHRSILVSFKGNLGGLWKLRINVFRILLDQGLDFIHSDADAVWLRNPIPEFIAPYPDTDLLISQGTIWPPEVHRSWGFVLCCGLFAMRSTPAMQSLLATLSQHVETTGDDQVSLNQVLLEKGITWEIPQPVTRLRIGTHQFSTSQKLITGTTGAQTVGVLPFRCFPRISHTDNTAYVSHPLTPKKAEAKKKVLQECGAWLLES